MYENFTNVVVIQCKSMCYRKVLRLDALAASRDKTVVSVIILHYSSCALAFILVQSTRAQNLERSKWDFFRLGWCGVLKRTIKHLLAVNLGILRTAVLSVDCIVVPFQYGDCFRFRDLFVIWLSNIAEYKPEPKKMSINSPKCSNLSPSRSSSWFLNAAGAFRLLHESHALTLHCARCSGLKTCLKHRNQRLFQTAPIARLSICISLCDRVPAYNKLKTHQHNLWDIQWEI